MMSEDIVFENLNINPDRICEGISKIGYKPSSALMDIIDNSIAAGATKIYIDLILKDNTTLSTKGNVLTFRIFDNGQGMDNDQIKTALDIGSIVTYPQGSLSKYGLGLKSAGFSLGNKILVVSQKQGRLSEKFYLDRNIIRENNSYGVCRSKNVDEDYRKILNSVQSGTIIEISSTINNQDSANKIKRELQETAGVAYFYYLSNSDNPVKISIRYRDKEENIVPKDIMFWDDAYETFDPETYDGKRPCKVLNEDIDNPFDLNGEKYKLEICLFPSSKMQFFSQFSEEERGLIKSFDVRRKNLGFFIYRNNRLIRWGDRLLDEEETGLVGKDEFGFRARILLTSEHDELFHVDVSKQNLLIPEEVLDTLQRRVNIPRRQWKELSKICSILLKQEVPGSEPGEKASTLLANFEEFDFDANIDPPKEKIQRNRRRIQETEDKKSNSSDKSLEDENFQDSSNIETFRKVRYSEKINSFDFWIAEKDTNNGTYVRINQMHAFHQLVLDNLTPSDPIRISIEGMLFCLAVAENLTIEDFSSLPYEQVIEVLNRFKRIFSQNLDSWSSKNQNLYE
jgi:Histidine kinase-, DNA gyrase B-, and HSP90-like ATPase